MYEHAVWQCIGRKCSDWPRGALGRRGAFYHGFALGFARLCCALEEHNRVKMGELFVKKSSRQTPPSPRVRQFHLPRAVLVYSRGMATLTTMATPKLNLEK